MGEEDVEASVEKMAELAKQAMSNGNVMQSDAADRANGANKIKEQQVLTTKINANKAAKELTVIEQQKPATKLATAPPAVTQMGKTGAVTVNSQKPKSTTKTVGTEMVINKHVNSKTTADLAVSRLERILKVRELAQTSLREKGLRMINAKNMVKDILQNKPKNNAEVVNARRSKLQRKYVRQEKFKMGLKQQQQQRPDAITTIEIDNDSDDSDIEYVPNPPQPVFTLDSDDAMDGNKESRCTSPCSVISSDDFILHADRKRLQQETRGAPNDKDLLDITAEISFTNTTTTNTQQEQTQQQQEEEVEKVQDKSKKSTNLPLNVFVNETAVFRAMDVYEESETDNNSKTRTSKQTNCITIDEDNETDSDQSVIMLTGNEKRNECANKVKRLRKRRNSELLRRLKTTQAGIDAITATADGCSPTAVSYIAKGPAIFPTAQKRIASTSASRMTDKKFLNRLNNLAQCREQMDGSDETDEEVADAPTARQMAEKLLQGEENKREAQQAKTDKYDEAFMSYSIAELQPLFDQVDKFVTLKSKYEKVMDRCQGYESDSSVDYLLDPELRPIAAQKKKEYAQAQAQAQIAEEQVSSQSEAEDVPQIGMPVERPSFYIHRTSYGAKNKGIGWPAEMRDFYDESWQDNGMALERLAAKLKGNKSNWKICPRDVYSSQQVRRRDLKCFNCSEYGHTRTKCKQPKKPLVCFMCGRNGHTVQRCPNSLCLNCGHKTSEYVRKCGNCRKYNDIHCSICMAFGHNWKSCTDLWRRYHSTINPNENPLPMKPVRGHNQRKYCSVCAGRGHFAEDCRQAERELDYSPGTTRIKSYAPAYKEIKNAEYDLKLKLLYDPEQRRKFRMAQNTKPHKYYGRFLKAVGLAHLMKTPVKKVQPGNTRTETITARKGVQEEQAKVKHELLIDLADEDDELDKSKKTETVETEEPQNDTADIAAIDSDSNYSFSENFPITITPKQPACNAKFDDEELPVFIPLSMHDDDEAAQEATEDFTDEADVKENNIANNSFKDLKGISKIFLPKEKPADTIEDTAKRSAATQEEEVEEEDATGKPIEEEVASEVRIYLNPMQAQFLLTPVGRTFLDNCVNKCGLKSQMAVSSLGHVLHVNGLVRQQEQFRDDLQLRIAEYTIENRRQVVEETYNVPRRVKPMIEFLRNSINQLFHKLGNVHDLLKRQQMYEDKPTKASMRAADKARRTLNMILLGQAGLLNGNMHLQRLIDCLKQLLAVNCQTTNNVEDNMRMEINNICKLIFTPYRHNNYTQLVKNYGQLPNKNLLFDMHIDPMLLGVGVINTQIMPLSLKNNQDESARKTNAKRKSGQDMIISQTTTTVTTTTTTETTTTTATNSNKKQQPTQQQQQQRQQKPSSLDNVLPTKQNNKRQNSNNNGNNKNNNNNKKPRMDDVPVPPNAPRGNLHQASVFWSRESIQYINDCLSVNISERLRAQILRVLDKARNGLLSFNDYRAVIELHNNVMDYVKMQQKQDDLQINLD